MRKVKKSLVLIILILVISSLATADCVSDCKEALNKADTVISDLKKEIDLYKLTVKTSQDALANCKIDVNEKNGELMSPFRNPFFVGSIGISIGAVLVLLLKH